MDTETIHPKKLYKSRRDKMIDGVCGGIAEYLEIDPTILRVLWVGSIFLGGAGVLAYIACMFILPPNPRHQKSAEGTPTGSTVPSQQRFWGILITVIGFLILLANLGVFAFLHIWHLSWTMVFSLFLIGVGLYLILRERREPEGQVGSATEGTEPREPFSGPRRLRKSRSERKLFGVCGGIAKHFDVDPSIVRILYVIFTLVTHGVGVLLYFLLALILPDETPQQV